MPCRQDFGGALCVGEVGQAAHDGQLHVINAQVEARQQDRGRHIASRQHICQVLIGRQPHTEHLHSAIRLTSMLQAHLIIARIPLTTGQPPNLAGQRNCSGQGIYRHLYIWHVSAASGKLFFPDTSAQTIRVLSAMQQRAFDHYASKTKRYWVGALL